MLHQLVSLNIQFHDDIHPRRIMTNVHIVHIQAVRGEAKSISGKGGDGGA